MFFPEIVPDYADHADLGIVARRERTIGCCSAEDMFLLPVGSDGVVKGDRSHHQERGGVRASDGIRSAINFFYSSGRREAIQVATVAYFRPPRLFHASRTKETMGSGFLRLWGWCPTPSLRITLIEPPRKP